MFSNNGGFRKSVSATDSSSDTSSNTSSHLSSVVLARQQDLTFSYDTETVAGPSMAQADWNNNNRFDRNRESTVFPVFTPAPRQPHQSMGGVGVNSHPIRQQRNENLQHQVTFSEAPNYKIIYLVALIIVSLLLISLIVIIIVLLATKRVFFYDPAHPPNNNVNNSPTTTIRLPSQMPQQPSQPTNQPHFITKTFECEIFIIDQANKAYDNENSIEYFQAKTILQNALANTFEGSSLRDMNPTISLEKLENSGSDFRIVFSVSIIVLEQNKALGEMSIRNLLLSQIGVLEGLINQTNIDGNRINVKEIEN
uniref:SEA domain-containing protein n=1 Tax=Meloidogyne hapla TaxID=6305 RepID=A0A1I8BMT3_MELHA